jgi:uncharacterized membrane protein YeaQ/YmgE (transglycosylase-associated protein family)
MGPKFVIYFSLFVGSAIGGYLPTLWHQGIFSWQSLLGSTIGAFAGLWIGYKINQQIGG